MIEKGTGVGGAHKLVFNDVGDHTKNRRQSVIVTPPFISRG